VLASIAAIVVNVAASVWLVGLMGFEGLALGTSIAALSNGAVLLLLLRHCLGGLNGGRLLTTATKITVAAVVMAVVAAGAERGAAAVAPGTNLFAQAIRLTMVILTALATLAAAARLLRIREFEEALQSIRRAQKLL
jgi:putative peptidoglycan lipid II flippase